MIEVTPKEIIELVKRLPDSNLHIHNERETPSITNEWLVGAFAGRGFTAPTLEEATQELIDYLYKHIGHDSMVGMAVDKSGFPNMKMVEMYCKSFTEED